MRTIVRIGNFPTTKLPGAGLHAYHLKNWENFHTVYISPKLDGDPLTLEGKDRLILFRDFLFKRKANQNKFLHGFKRILGTLRFNLQAINQLIKIKPDILHIHSPYYLPSVVFTRLLGIHCFMTYHGSDFNAVRNSKIYPLMIKGIEKALYLGSHMKDGLEKIHGQDRIIETFNGVDVNFFKNEGVPRKKNIIAVGALKKEKGFTFLLDAFAKLISHDHFSDYKLLIVGQGVLDQDLKDQCRRLEIDGDVEFLGHLDREKLLPLYQSAELFVLSSISEGFPKVLLEAMACGCKIASTNVGSVPDILGDNYKAMAHINDHDALFQSMKYALETERDTALDEIVNKYTWEMVSEQYELVYNKCLSH